MKRIIKLILLLTITVSSIAQDVERISFSSNNLPRKLKVDLLYGSIAVTGYEKENVIVKAVARDNTKSPGLQVRETNNLITVVTSNIPVDIEIKLPEKVDLKLTLNNDGNIVVNNINGIIEASNLNGKVILNNINGAAVVDAINDEIRAGFINVKQDEPMYFSSMNGNISLTLPNKLSADVYIENEYGKVNSEFDWKELTMKSLPVKKKGTWWRINKGEAEIHIINFNGNINVIRGE